MGQPLTEPLNVGIVGCGAISGAYLATFERLAAVRLTAVADLDAARSGAVAAAYGVAARTVAELVRSDDVDLVLNLTVPAAHAEVAHRAIDAGKAVYGEKPLAADVVSAREVLDAARARGVVVACAPDTVLGTGTQTARRAVDDGLIGRPVAATATMVTPGHESWHPDPDFYYQQGGGPLLDMGPYYVSSLVTLLGPVVRVVGASGRTRSERTIGSGARAGERIPVDVDTHVTGVLEHASGALSTLVMSFDAVATRASSIEIHGETGSLVVPDPNGFDGDVLLATVDRRDWTLLPPSAGYRGASRGYGVADLALTAPGELPRASGALAFHVLETMTALVRAAREGVAVPVTSTVERPAPVTLGDAPGGLRSASTSKG